MDNETDDYTRSYAYRLGWTEQTLSEVLSASTSLDFREARKVAEDVGNGEHLRTAVKRHAEDPDTVLNELRPY